MSYRGGQSNFDQKRRKQGNIRKSYIFIALAVLIVFIITRYAFSGDTQPERAEVEDRPFIGQAAGQGTFFAPEQKQEKKNHEVIKGPIGKRVDKKMNIDVFRDEKVINIAHGVLNINRENKENGVKSFGVDFNKDHQYTGPLKENDQKTNQIGEIGIGRANLLRRMKDQPRDSMKAKQSIEALKYANVKLKEQNQKPDNPKIVLAPTGQPIAPTAMPNNSPQAGGFGAPNNNKRTSDDRVDVRSDGRIKAPPAPPVKLTPLYKPPAVANKNNFQSDKTQPLHPINQGNQAPGQPYASQSNKIIKAPPPPINKQVPKPAYQKLAPRLQREHPLQQGQPQSVNQPQQPSKQIKAPPPPINRELPPPPAPQRLPPNESQLPVNNNPPPGNTGLNNQWLPPPPAPKNQQSVPSNQFQPYQQKPANNLPAQVNQGQNNQGQYGQGQYNQGQNNQGQNNQRQYNQVQNNQRQYNQVQNNQRQYNHGQNNQGQLNQGQNNQGLYNQGQNNQGQYNQVQNNQRQNNQGYFNQNNLESPAVIQKPQGIPPQPIGKQPHPAFEQQLGYRAPPPPLNNGNQAPSAHFGESSDLRPNADVFKQAEPPQAIAHAAPANAVPPSFVDDNGQYFEVPMQGNNPAQNGQYNNNQALNNKAAQEPHPDARFMRDRSL